MQTNNTKLILGFIFWAFWLYICVERSVQLAHKGGWYWVASAITFILAYACIKKLLKIIE